MFDEPKKPQPTPLTPPTPQTSAGIPPAPTSPMSGATVATPAGGEEIHTMPMEYYLGSKTTDLTKGGQVVARGPVQPSAPGSKKKWLNIIIIVVLVVIVGVSVYLLVKSFEKPLAQQVAQEETKLKTEAPKEETKPVVSEKPAEEATVIPEKKGLDFDPAKISKFSLSLMKAADKDKDGLTDVEEALIGTDSNLVDTDKDTYRDAEELGNFYSPLDKGGVKLESKDFLKSYTNNVYGYKFLYPTKWLAAALDDKNPREVMVTASENEFINIFIDEKETDQALDAWYLEKAPSVTVSELKHFKTYKKLTALESPDGFTVYLNQGNDVYIINYNIGLKEEASFPNLFQVLVDSFEFVAPQPVSLDYEKLILGLGLGLTIDQTKVTTKISCGGESCLNEALLECNAGTTAEFKLTESVTYKYEVMGSKEGGCEVKLSFIAHPNPDWQGKTMNCIYNRTKGFVESVQDMTKCSGDLYKLISATP